MTPRSAFFLALGMLACSLMSMPVGATDPIPLQVGMGLAKPPYIMPPGEGGLEYEIVDQAFASVGYRMVPQYFPQARALGLIRAGKLDVMLGVTEGIGGDDFFSDGYIVYQNTAMTLTSRHIALAGVEDLAQYSVAAFQNASLVLGPHFRAVVSGHRNYTEHPQQITQNRLLYTGRVDVVIGDRLIFRYFNGEVEKKIDASQPVTFHELFPLMPRKAVFRDSHVRDQFNLGLKAIKKNGVYAAIVKKYQQQLAR